MPKVALATCAELPDLDDDDRRVLDLLRERGIDAVPAVWDDPSVEWGLFDLTVVRSTWDYASRRDKFLVWATSVPRLANPAKLIEWNTDKTYLRDLSAADVPVVPTAWIEPGNEPALPDGGEFVVKPSVSAGSMNTGRYRLDRRTDRQAAKAHVERLQQAGLTTMVQPYVAGVDTAGETALIFIAGRFSHAIRKGPMLSGPDSSGTELYRDEQIDPRDPSDAETDLAKAALDAVPGGQADLLYARVDMVPNDDGVPVVLEVELTEPSLFLAHGGQAEKRLADGISSAL